ncbi:MAG TPA: Xaa-Pro aminopeptidase [Gemmatimonadaceae bacterium]|nr:Xaa-Pro aminopeptidase [Gemmatimonadaceae bacterium]
MRSLSAQIPLAEYAARRNALAAELDSGVVVAFGAREPMVAWGQFRQHPAFRYLTNFDEPDAVLVLVKRGGTLRNYIFTNPVSPRYQLYVGIPADSASVARATGLSKRPLPALRAMLDSLVGSGLPLYTLADFGSGDASGRDTVTLGASFVADLKRSHPSVTIHDAHPLVDKLRARKSPQEMALLRRAIAITDDAHRAAMAAMTAGIPERAIQAVIERTFLEGGAEGPGFGSIVGSGPNSTTLHYVKNTRTMRAGDVVVMDIGASYEGYSADITRTVPVSGRFTADQRAVYEIVLEAQKAAERATKVGVSRNDWQAAADSVIARGLARLGLIESSGAEFDAPWSNECERRARLCKQYALWMPHGLGHGIGLEVHDPAIYYEEAGTFGEGDVFTIEPGIYVNPDVLKLLPDTPRNRALMAKIRGAVTRYANTGVRIEDDFVVTARGLERLSKAPREIAEVEAAMRKPVP